MCTLRNSGKTALQFFPIDEDIAKRGIIVVSLAEPAVIQHHEFKSKISRTGSKSIHLFFVKIKIGRFPIIDENRPHGIAIFPAHNVMAHRLMKCLTHAIQPLCTKGKHRLRGLEFLLHPQPPAKAYRLNTADHPRRTELLHFRL